MSLFTRCLALALVSLFLSSCIDYEQEFTINPDGSGKLEFVASTDLMTIMEAQGGDDSEFAKGMAQGLRDAAIDDFKKTGAADLAQFFAGIEAWDKATVTPDGDTAFKVTMIGYFEDLNDVAIVAGGGNNGSQGRSAKQIPIFKYSRKGDVAIIKVDQSSDGSTGEVEDFPLSSEEAAAKLPQARKDWAVEREKYAHALKNLNYVFTLRVPGTIVKQRNFTTGDASHAKFVLKGANVLDSYDKATSNDEVAIQALRKGGSLADGLQSSGTTAIFGTPDEVPAIRVKVSDNPLFDYKAEVARIRGQP